MTREEIKEARDRHFHNMEIIQERRDLIMDEARQDVCRCTNLDEMESVLMVYIRRFSDCRKYYEEEENEWIHYYKDYELIINNITDSCEV